MQFLWQHPLNHDAKLKGLWRYFHWQISSKIAFGPMIIDYIQGSKLIAKKGWSSITANIYVGLSEFEEMFFTLHLLTAKDYFVDVGANLGIYTILAGAVCKTKCLAIEPIYESFQWLKKQVYLNGIENRVEVLNIGVGSSDCKAKFLCDADSLNFVITANMKIPCHRKTVIVPIKPLDKILIGQCPTLIKVDIEGFEGEMIKGANQTLQQANLLAVIIELAWGGGQRYGSNDNNLHEKMLKYGFKPFSYSPQTRALTLLSQHNQHGNTIYLKKTKIPEIIARLKIATPIKIFNKIY